MSEKLCDESKSEYITEISRHFRHHHPRSEFPCDDDQIPHNSNPEDGDHFRGSFRVFFNPLEMDKFFNQQFDEMLKIFGFGHGGQHEQFFPLQQDELPDNEGTRDFMLKRDNHPGYLKADFNQKDTEIEADQVSPEDLSKLYSSPAPQPYSTQRFQTQSFSSRTVQLPDGSVEEHTTVKDHEGRETSTVTKKTGEECMTATTIIHPDGKVERHESNTCPQLQEFGRLQIGESIMDKLFRF